MVQDGVDVVEDVPLGDGGVTVVRAEVFEGGVGDVLAAVGAVGGVGVEGKHWEPPCGSRSTTDLAANANIGHSEPTFSQMRWLSAPHCGNILGNWYSRSTTPRSK